MQQKSGISKKKKNPNSTYYIPIFASKYYTPICIFLKWNTPKKPRLESQMFNSLVDPHHRPNPMHQQYPGPLGANPV